MRAELESRVRAANVNGIIRFLGFRSDLPAILQAVDCVVLPSIASENLSVAVLEGLMAGTPAIVTEVGGMAEAVIDGVTGFVVSREDPHAIGAAMLKMVADPAATRRMGANARSDALVRFTRRRMMDEYVKVLDETINRTTKGMRA